jgi:hypothetical protein
MRKLLVLALLAPGLAFGAVVTRSIGGKVLMPDGAAPASGSVTCTLSQPGSTLDGTTSQRVAAFATGTIGATGALTLGLIPNDAITPVGTAYSCVFFARTTSGRSATWSEVWQVPSGVGTLDVGAVPRLSTAPPVAGSYVGTAPSYTATAGSGSSAFVQSTGAKLCGDGSGCTANLLYSGSAWTFTPALTAGAPTGASYLTLAFDSTLSAERVLQGTASQIDLADTGANGTLTLSLPTSPSVSGAWTSTAGSGANAFAVATNGARIDFGSGASDYASSDGTTVAFAGPISTPGNVSAFRVTVSGQIIFSTTTALGTCGSGLEGWIYRNAGGTSGARTKLCLCTSDGAGTPAYAWKNITTVFASEAASIGTTTTCP